MDRVKSYAREKRGTTELKKDKKENNRPQLSPPLSLHSAQELVHGVRSLRGDDLLPY